MKIEIDHREPKHIVDFFQKHNVPVVITQLEHGDFRYSKTIIERKAIKDLVRSLHDGRLWSQIQKLQSLGSYTSYVIISGSIEEAQEDYAQRGSSINEMAVYGAIASIAVRYPGVQILWVQNDKELCILVWKIMEKMSEGKFNVPRVLNYTKATILSLILKISISSAKRILKHFGDSLRLVVLATEEELQKVNGIGPKKAKQIVKKLG